MVADSIHSNAVEYDANQNGIDSVTVYQTDRAEIRRRVNVQLKKGQNDVVIRNLPTCLQEDSIRVDGIGNAVIFDVVYHSSPLYDQTKNAEALKDLTERQDKLNAESRILSREAKVLSDYSKTLGGNNADANRLVAFLDAYRDRQRVIDDEATRLRAELSTLNAEESERWKQLNAEEENVRKRGTRLTVVVLADGPGEAELTLTYVVTHAWWLPHYDVRAVIAGDGNAKDKGDSSVALHYRASISQKTGEDWAGVQLTLSTASPLQGTDVPTVNPCWVTVRPSHPIGFRRNTGLFGDGLPHGFGGAPVAKPEILIIPASQPEIHEVFEQDRLDTVYTPPARSLSPEPVSIAAMGRPSAIPQGGFGVGGRSSPEPPSFFRGVDSRATEGAVSTTFAIPGLSTIPSDSNEEQQTHKVSVAELDFASVDLEWVAVPRDTPSAFLRCKVKNTSNYVLLPGQANIFLNGGFVAKSDVPPVSQQESFSCSLGIDPAIRITYHPQTKKTRTSGGNIVNLMGSKTTVTSYEQKITVKNTRLTRLPRLLVKDQVPVSRDARVKVTVSEPKGLQGQTISNGTQKRGKTGKDGVSARWSSWKADSGSEEADGDSTVDEGVKLDADAAQGRMEWVCDVRPGATVDLKLAWEISAPIDVEWTVQKSG